MSADRPTKPLGELATFVNGRAFQPSDWGRNGLPIIRIQNLTDRERPFNYYSGEIDERHRVRNGDVLVSWSASLGSFEWDRGDAALNQHIFKVTENEGVDRQYLRYAIENALDVVKAATHGSTMKHITKGEFESVEVPSPDYAEQRRIAVRVREAMERVEEIERLRSEIEANSRRMFVQVVRERFDSLSNGEMVPLEAVAEMIGGGSLPEPLDAGDSDGAILGVKVGDLNLPGNEVEVSTSRGFVRAGTRGRVAPPGSTVLPKRGGAIATNKKRRLGRSAMIDPNLMAVVPKAGQLESSFLHAWFEQIDLVTISNGGVIPQLNKKDLVPLRIPRLPLDVQRRIGEEVDRARTACSTLVNSGGDAAHDVVALRTAILRHAFSGKL